jgi:ribonuclease T1
MLYDRFARSGRLFGALSLLWMLWVCTPLAQARSVPEAIDGAIGLQQLPREGQDTYRLIHQGGPFPYDKDGVVFGNRERMLPRQARGYYHEYTVKTPGERTRGARRIVCGGLEVQRPQNCYYSDDHYTTFREIVDKK